MLERICPNCGTSNPTTNTRCHHCNTNLISPAVPRQSNLPIRLENARTVGLALGVTALVTRVGLNFIVRKILPRVAQGLIGNRSSLAQKQSLSDVQSDYVIQGWRSWSIRRGEEHIQGSEQFEWRINKRKE